VARPTRPRQEDSRSEPSDPLGDSVFAGEKVHPQGDLVPLQSASGGGGLELTTYGL